MLLTSLEGSLHDLIVTMVQRAPVFRDRGEPVSSDQEPRHLVQKRARAGRG